jgi:hypothetical protein
LFDKLAPECSVISRFAPVVADNRVSTTGPVLEHGLARETNGNEIAGNLAVEFSGTRLRNSGKSGLLAAEMPGQQGPEFGRLSGLSLFLTLQEIVAMASFGRHDG